MKVSNPAVTNLPQDTETQSCETTQATQSAPSDTASNVKTAAKIASTAIDQFEKFAGTSGDLAKFAGPAQLAKYGLKGLGAGITASQQFDKAASTTTAGKLAEAGAAGGMALAVSMSPLAPFDLVTGGEITKGMAASTSAAITLADGVATGETAGVENLLEKMRSGEHGWYGKQLAKISDMSSGELGVFVADQLEEGILRDALDGKGGIYLADKLESFKESLKNDDKK